MTCICIDIIFFLFQNLNRWDLTKGKSKLRDFDGFVLSWLNLLVFWPNNSSKKKGGKPLFVLQKNRALTFKDDIKYGKGKREFVLKIMKHKEWIHISCDVGLCLRKRLGYFQNLLSPPLFNFTLPGLDKVGQGLVLIAAPASMGVELRRQAFEVT